MTPGIEMRVFLVTFAAALAVSGQGDPLMDGLLAFQRGDYVSAEKSLRSALAKHEDARARVFLDLTFAATSRCNEARAGLAKHIDNPDVDLAKLSGIALAQCLLAEGKIDDAWPVIRKLRERHPGDADVLYVSSRLYNRAWNDAVYQLYQRSPASYRVNQMSAEVLETQGKFAEAALEYRKAIDKNPQALNLRFRLGRVLLMSSQGESALKEALRQFEAELALNPMDAVAEYQAGQVLVALMKPEEAVGRLRRALELKPDFPEALVALGKVRIEQKKNDEAISLLQKAVQLAPKNEPARYNLMLAYRNAGRMEDAKFQKAELDKLQKPPEGEFAEFLKKLGEKRPEQ